MKHIRILVFILLGIMLLGCKGRQGDTIGLKIHEMTVNGEEQSFFNRDRRSFFN